MITTDIRVALASAFIVLALAGCSAPEATPSHPDESSEAAEDVVAYPPGFPTDRVPMFDGTLLHVAHPGNLWAAWIESDDLLSDLATATQLLVDDGFTVTASADGFAEFTNGDRTLRIVASVDANYGSCLAYTITDGAIEATDAPEQDAGSGGDH